MDGHIEKAQLAWQPLTARGVAAFAGASWGRLLLVQFILALLAAAVVLWFLDQAWFPPIREAIHQLPAEGQILSGTLDWRGNSPQCLAENRFLALAVDLEHQGQAGSTAHVQVELGRRNFKISSLLGYCGSPYPTDLRVPLNRVQLEPWWGAWAPAILAMVAAAMIIGLLLSWTLLATVYSLPVWLIGFFANRDLNLRGSWRLAGAALMPGALFMTITIFFYGLGVVDPIRLAVAAAAHLVMGWVYLLASPLTLPRHPAVPVEKENPFVAAVKPQGEAPQAKPSAGAAPPTARD